MMKDVIPVGSISTWEVVNSNYLRQRFVSPNLLAYCKHWLLNFGIGHVFLDRAIFIFNIVLVCSNQKASHKSSVM